MAEVALETDVEAYGYQFGLPCKFRVEGQTVAEHQKNTKWQMKFDASLEINIRKENHFAQSPITAGRYSLASHRRNRFSSSVHTAGKITRSCSAGLRCRYLTATVIVASKLWCIYSLRAISLHPVATRKYTKHT